MKNSLYTYVTTRFLILIVIGAISSAFFSRNFEILGDTYIDMDDKNNWEWVNNGAEQIRSCNYSSCGICDISSDHWHWGAAHIWIVWGAAIMTLVNLIFILNIASEWEE
jgi:hypothetical protein